MAKEITLGCDPEFFVKNDEGHITPICGKVGGTKKSPVQIHGMPEGFMVQEDGPAVEFNIPPVTEATAFIKTARQAFSEISERYLFKHSLIAADVRQIELKDEWIKAYPHLGQIGCDPDFNAYSTSGDDRGGLPDAMKAIRGAGGHIHIGYPKDLIPPEILVKFIDLTCTLPTLHKDSQLRRRKWWGQAGTFRPKPYGVEYRTLSNFWLFNSSYGQTIASTILALMDSLGSRMPKWVSMYDMIPWDSVKTHINAEDGPNGLKLIAQLRKEFPLLADLQRHGGL